MTKAESLDSVPLFIFFHPMTTQRDVLTFILVIVDKLKI